MNMMQSHSIEITSVDTKWIDTHKACEGKPMQIRSRVVAENSDVEMGQICTHGLLRWKHWKPESVVQQFKSTHSQSCTSTCHVHTFIRKAQKMVLISFPVEESMGADACQHWIVENEHVRHTGRSKQLGA